MSTICDESHRCCPLSPHHAVSLTVKDPTESIRAAIVFLYILGRNFPPTDSLEVSGVVVVFCQCGGVLTEVCSACALCGLVFSCLKAR